MTCFSQTGKKIVFGSIYPEKPGFYWFCDHHDLVVNVAEVENEDGSLCAHPVGWGGKIRKSNFCDFLWAPATLDDVFDLRAHTTRLAEVHWNEPVKTREAK